LFNHSVGGLSHFNALVSYEDLATAIDIEGTDRAKYRAQLVQRAIEQARSFVLIDPAEVTAFWHRVFDIASNKHPELRMLPPGEKTSYSAWIHFKANLPPNITIDWRIPNGMVLIAFWTGAPHKPLSTIDLSGLGASIGGTKKTVAIELPVGQPPRKWTEMTDNQIHEALEAADRILKFYQSNSDSFG
jgi:hypothetical protein